MKIKECKFLDLWGMSYTTIFDDSDIKIPIIRILDKTPDTEIGQYSSNNNIFDSFKLLFQ